MSGLRKEVVHVPAVETAKPESVVTTAFKLRELDLNKCTTRELSYNVPFELKALHTSSEVVNCFLKLSRILIFFVGSAYKYCRIF